MLAARDRRRARAVGQHVRVQRRLRVLDHRRLPVPPAPLPDPLDRVPPDRRRPRDAAVRLEPAVRHQAARAGAPERAAPDDPRRHGGHRLRDLRDELRGGRRLPRPGHRTTGSPGCRRTRCSTRSRTGGDHRLPDLRDDDHPGLVVGVDRLVALLGLGPQGDRRPRHVADLRGLPARPQPALVGRPARPRCCWSWASGWCW